MDMVPLSLANHNNMTTQSYTTLLYVYAVQTKLLVS
jgi:hypothetical protein